MYLYIHCHNSVHTNFSRQSMRITARINTLSLLLKRHCISKQFVSKKYFTKIRRAIKPINYSLYQTLHLYYLFLLLDSFTLKKINYLKIMPFICNLFFVTNSYIEHDRVCGFWTWLFVLSKLPELGDTLFIVLRKQPLIFLHWYHHITVLIYSWYSYTEYTSSARWFIVMNYCVHSVMYSYYALRAMGYKPPRFIPMVITSMQLTQMIVGCTINLWAHDYLQTMNSSACNISPMNIKLSVAMYFSYFVLFARFFYATYLSPNARKGKRAFNNSVQENQKSQMPASDAYLQKLTRSTLSKGNGIGTIGNYTDKFKEQQIKETSL